MGLTIGVAGAGIAGMTLAASLQERGVEVIVLERQAELRDTGAGISLWPNALAALDAVGLGVLVRSLGKPLAAGGQRKLDGGAGLTFSQRSFEAALGEGLVCVDRGGFVRAVADRLRPGTVRTSCLVTGYDVGHSEVRVRVADSDELAVDALVGADGINSAIAHQLSGPLRSSYSGYVAWRGIAEAGCQVESNEVWLCLAGGHEFGWMPVATNRTYWFATAWLPEESPFSGNEGEYLKETFKKWPKPIADLLAATPADRLVRSNITDRAVPERWSRGPVTLAGDAAHPMRPHLGQGGCQAIEDAVVLARCLGASGDPADAFARYERRRRQRARLVVHLSRMSGFTRPPGAATTAIDRMTTYLPRISLGPSIRLIAPIAGYGAGQRAIRLRRHYSGI